PVSASLQSCPSALRGSFALAQFFRRSDHWPRRQRRPTLLQTRHNTPDRRRAFSRTTLPNSQEGHHTSRKTKPHSSRNKRHTNGKREEGNQAFHPAEPSDRLNLLQK